MSKTKKPITLTKSRVDRIVKQVSEKTLLLFIATAMDEFDWTEDDVERFAIRFNRYSGYADDHVLSLKKFRTIIEDTMGVTLGWGEDDASSRK